VTGVEIVEGYGMSETSPVISVNPVNANRLGTIGIAVPRPRCASSTTTATRWRPASRASWWCAARR